MNMSLHSHEARATRLGVREQPSPAGAWARKPANPSHGTGDRRRNETCAGSFPASSQLCTSVQRRDRRTRSMFLEHVLWRRPLRTPWGPASRHIEFVDHGGNTSPVVLTGPRRSSSLGGGHFPSSGSSAGVASSGVTAPKRRAAENADVRLSRSNARPRHTHYHPSSRRADVLKGVVFHAVAPSFATLRVQPPSMSRRVSESLPEGRFPCWSTPTWRRSLPSCWTSHPSAQET